MCECNASTLSSPFQMDFSLSSNSRQRGAFVLCSVVALKLCAEMSGKGQFNAGEPSGAGRPEGGRFNNDTFGQGQEKERGVWPNPGSNQKPSGGRATDVNSNHTRESPIGKFGAGSDPQGSVGRRDERQREVHPSESDVK